MSNTEILLLRHGESLGNSLKIMAGQYDVDLTERGYKQAEAAAAFLAGQGIDVIYSSDLKRAYNTALVAAKSCGLNVLSTSPNLREISLGSYEGVKFSEIAERFDPDFKLYFTSSFGTYSFPNGETTAEAGERFHNEVLRIARLHSHKRILIAAHAGVIRSFWGIISNIPRDELGDRIPFATNASVSRVYFDGKIFIPVSYSENSYLKEVGFIDYSKSRI